MATAAQQDKFTKFQSRPLRDECLKMVRTAISVGGLATTDRGKKWGVTVCPDNKTLIRLNVGNVSQMSVRRGISKRIDPSEETYFILVAVRQGHLGMLGVPRGLFKTTGFVKHVEDSIVIFGSLDDWSDGILSNKRVVRAMQAHIDAARRTLPDSNWHNPLVDSLL